MKVLFIGGTGTISSACAVRCVESGMDLYLLNRGRTNRAVPENTTLLKADYHDVEQVQQALSGETFDVVVDFIAFTKEHVRKDVDLFRGRTGHYIFISTASAYQTPPLTLPVTEDAPLENPYWEYSREKIACERYLMEQYRENGFPVTIVRPSHTYDYRTIPFPGGPLLFDRARRKKKVIVHGDGTSLWTLTHNTDFARGFVGLLGNEDAIGQPFHITSDEYLPWNRICEILLDSTGLDAEIIHLPSDFIARYHEEFGAGLLGDKSHSMLFDNSRIKRYVPDFSAVVPFEEGAKEIADWYHDRSGPLNIDTDLDTTMDQMIADYESIL